MYQTMYPTRQLAMAYVPFHNWGEQLYPVFEGLKNGTMFPSLKFPFRYGGTRL